MSPELVYEAWLAAVTDAYRLARGERLAELWDRRPKLFDARGLHPFTLAVGRVWVCQELLPELRECEFDPVLMRVEAKRDAEATFREELMDATRT